MSDEELSKLPCRLAIRAEGEYINAYFAELDTMENAVLLGSVKKSICDKDRAVFDEFREFMQKAFGSAAKQVIGSDPVWGEPERAPEHERSGNA